MIEEYKLAEMMAYEGFIRRAAEANMPFMLKGSYVTRQYFENPLNRIPGDVDWLYMDTIINTTIAEKIFSDWATLVTEYKMHDGVIFRSFKEDAFWRMIDYAMADDFPTINTDLSCTVDGKEFRPLRLDVSFNLPLEAQPIPLLYRPLLGNPFTVPYTPPLCLQVAWKLHQTLVRPRFKDVFDLISLLQHSSFDEECLQQTLNALAQECTADNVDITRLSVLLSGNTERFFGAGLTGERWYSWRGGHTNFGTERYGNFEKAEDITNANLLPLNFKPLAQQFIDALIKAGFTAQLMSSLPRPATLLIEKRGEVDEHHQPGGEYKELPAKTGNFTELIKKLFK